MTTDEAEGWAFPTYAARKAHYIVKGRSLCGRYAYWGDFNDAGDQTTHADKPGPQDCVTCWAKAVARKEVRGITGA